MKNNTKRLMKVMIVFLGITIMFGCTPPAAMNTTELSAPPAGIAQAYNDAEWEILSNEEGTFAYQIPAEQMPDIAVGDQIVHNENELLEVVSVIEKTDNILVVHTVDGNMASLFPEQSTLSLDTKTMTATVEYVPAGRSIASAYSLPVTLKKVRETNPDGSETVLFDDSIDNNSRAITLINHTKTTNIVNIDKTYTQDIFNVSGSGSQSSGKVNVTYSGDAKLTLTERIKLKADFNLRLYMNLDGGIRTEKRTKTIRYYFFGWRTSTITYYVLKPWIALNKDLKASVSANAILGATADLTCNGSVSATYREALPINLTYNFMIGIIPVEIGYTPYLAVTAQATGTLNATTGASINLDGEWGAYCNNSGWGKISTLTTSFDYTPPTMTAAASISIIPKIENEVRAGIGFANTGVYGTVTVSPYLSLTASTGTLESDRTWDISAGILGSVGVKASVVGYDLGRYDATILNYKKEISSGTY